MKKNGLTYQWKRVMSGKDVALLLKEHGWEKLRQKGSHIIFAKNGFTCPVPNHKEIKAGTLKNIQHIINIAESK